MLYGPPRAARCELVPQLGSLQGLSIHSCTLPVMSNVALSSLPPLPTIHGWPSRAGHIEIRESVRSHSYGIQVIQRESAIRFARMKNGIIWTLRASD